MVFTNTNINSVQQNSNLLKPETKKLKETVPKINKSQSYSLAESISLSETKKDSKIEKTINLDNVTEKIGIGTIALTSIVSATNIKKLSNLNKDIANNLKSLNVTTTSIKEMKKLPIKVNLIKQGSVKVGSSGIMAKIGPGIMTKLIKPTGEKVALIEKTMASVGKGITATKNTIGLTEGSLAIAKNNIKLNRNSLYILGAGVGIVGAIAISKTINTENNSTDKIDKNNNTTNKIATGIALTSTTTGLVLSAKGVKKSNAGIKTIEKGFGKINKGVSNMNNSINSVKQSVSTQKIFLNNPGPNTKDLQKLAIKAKSSNSKLARSLGKSLLGSTKKTSIVDKASKGQNLIKKSFGTIKQGKGLTHLGAKNLANGAKLIRTGNKVVAVGLAVAGTIAVGGMVYNHLNQK